VSVRHVDKNVDVDKGHAPNGDQIAFPSLLVGNRKGTLNNGPDLPLYILINIRYVYR